METIVNYKHLKNTDNKYTIRKFDNPPILAESLAEEILNASLRAESENKPFHISLSGGSTPKILFLTLVQPHYIDSIKWDYLHFWWGDERMVPHSSEESNYGQAYKLLFSKIESSNGRLHPVNGENDIDNEVITYGNEMKNIMPVVESLPVHDWVILGMGDDGHTASLFPGGADLESSEPTIAATHPVSEQLRVSLTLKTINAAKRVTFLVTGFNKQERLLEIFTDRENHIHYPAARVENKNLEWWLDDKAAMKLPSNIQGLKFKH